MRSYDENRRAWAYAVWAGMAVACICAMHVNALAAQSGAEAKFNAQRAVWARYKTWMNASWSADPGNVYVDVRRRIDRQIASGKKPVDVFNQYKTQYDRRPTDQALRFGYDYSAIVFKRLNTGSFNREADKALSNICFLFEYSGTPPPHTYSFVRLSFLSIDLGSPEFIDVGRRLLEADTSDLDVKYQLALDLNQSKIPADRVQAMKYALDIVRLRPNDFRTYKLLGDIERHTAMLNHDPAAVGTCVAAFRRAESLVPAGSDEHVSLDEDAKVIQKRAADWSANP